MERKIQETENELSAAELIAGSKENIGAELSSRPAAPIPVVDLSAEKNLTDIIRHEGHSTQRPKPLGFNNTIPIVSTPPSKMKSSIQDPVSGVVPKATPMTALPNWSLLSDSPASSMGSPAPTNRADIDDMAEAMTALKLRLH